MRDIGLNPDTWSYAALLAHVGATAGSGATGGGAAQAARDLLNVMRARDGLDPDVWVFNAALGSCEKAHLWESALELLSEVGWWSAVVSGGRLLFLCWLFRACLSVLVYPCWLFRVGWRNSVGAWHNLVIP